MLDDDNVFDLSVKIKDLFEELGYKLHGVTYGNEEMKWHVTFPNNEEYKLVLEKADHMEGK